MTAPIPEPAAQRTGRGGYLQAAILDVGPVVFLGLLTLTTGDFDRPRTDEVTLLFVVLPLVLRRIWPIPVLAAVSAGAALMSGESTTPWVQISAVMLAAYTVADLARDRTQSALVVVIAAAALALAFIVQDADPVEAVILPFAFLVPAWLLGDIVRGRRIEAAHRADEVARSLREREERLAAAAADERRHVARELHDVVSHAVSVMVIQAGAARQVLRTSPDEAEGAMLAVETTGREAMTELRRFLGALSDDDDEAAGRAPQPGIDEIPALVDRVREAGLPASLEIDGTARIVPTSIDVAVFRIVQEALTNALRYAERAATLVRLSWEPDQIRLEILDDGPAGSVTDGAGRGLVGMRERASLVGGRLEAGPRVGGGFAVRAWLPLEPGLAEPGNT